MAMAGDMRPGGVAARGEEWPVGDHKVIPIMAVDRAAAIRTPGTVSRSSGYAARRYRTLPSSIRLPPH